METILNLLPLTAQEQDAFQAAAPDATHWFRPVERLRFSEPFTAEDALAEATVIFGCLPPELLPKCPHLKWMQTWSAGVNPYLAPGVFPKGVMLTSAVGAYGQSVSEHMFACLLASMKHLPEYRDNQRQHRWADAGFVKTLKDALVMILGTGDLGSHFAELVKAVGGHTIGFNRHPGKLPHFETCFPFAELDEWLPRADVVALTLPEAPETIHLFNQERLMRMKKDAILINAGRGTAVDCLALAEVLQTGHLWGAILDVTEPEPLPADHPLWDCPNLLLTPHTAGGDHLAQTPRNVAAIALENLKNYLAGRPLRNRVL